MKQQVEPASTAKRALGLSDPAVKAAFDQYPDELRARLMALRQIILETAAATAGVGALEETLKWGQPSYITTATRSGSTIRIDRNTSSNPASTGFASAGC